MSHTWHEVLYAAGRRNRIPTRPVCLRMTSAELHLCEDLTSSAQLGDEQREEEMEKQLLFFFFYFLCISMRSVMCQKNKSRKMKMEAVLRCATPPAERISELCSFPPAEQSRLHP